MKKKMLSLVLATTMILGMSMTAFAATKTETTDVSGNDVTTISGNDLDGENVASGSVTMTSSLQELIISVTITKNGNVIANPYGLAVDSVTDTLIGSEIDVVNESNAPIEVGLAGSIAFDKEYTSEQIKAKENIVIAKSADKVGDASQKTIFVQAEVKADGDALLDAKGKAVEALVYAEKAVSLKTSPVLAAKDFGGKDVTITASKNATPTKIGETSESMKIVISGATGSPTVVWKNDDTFKVITAYDLKLSKTPSAFGTPQS